MPASAKIAVRISGPRIDAPNIPAHFAICHPAIAVKTMIASCDGAMLAAGAPGGFDRSASHTPCRMNGKATTITITRVAWISDMARTLPPASSPKTSMSCNPPGIVA